MHRKIITGTYSAGYGLATHYRRLSITPSGDIGGRGLDVYSVARVVNGGTIAATTNGGQGAYLAQAGEGAHLVNAGAGIVRGGAGAAGAAGTDTGRDGGAGGQGVFANVGWNVTNHGLIAGGGGGVGGYGYQLGGTGGAGGAALVDASISLQNSGVIAGGVGGGYPAMPPSTSGPAVSEGSARCSPPHPSPSTTAARSWAGPGVRTPTTSS